MKDLRRKRKELGLTQIQAANVCGVSRRTYQTYEETDTANATYDELYKKLDEIDLFDGSNYVANIKMIKRVCADVFANEYPEVEAAYLFGSYARNEATGKSDIDIVVVCPPLGMRFYGMATLLGEHLHKEIDLHSHRELLKNQDFLEQVLKDGIKIYVR